jgi:hypothetical protein
MIRAVEEGVPFASENPAASSNFAISMETPLLKSRLTGLSRREFLASAVAAGGVGLLAPGWVDAFADEADPRVAAVVPHAVTTGVATAVGKDNLCNQAAWAMFIVLTSTSTPPGAL